jgi:hypothetical protein
MGFEGRGPIGGSLDQIQGDQLDLGPLTTRSKCLVQRAPEAFSGC